MKKNLMSNELHAANFSSNNILVYRSRATEKEHHKNEDMLKRLNEIAKNRPFNIYYKTKTNDPL
ncbi:MAG TPA: hypothetical protein VKT28_08700 [Puia sp.]|nr:hypothetical protein [Puia sp.]